MCEIPANIPAHERKLREQKLEEEEDLVDKLLKEQGMDLRLTPYRVLATSPTMLESAE